MGASQFLHRLAGQGRKLFDECAVHEFPEFRGSLGSMFDRALVEHDLRLGFLRAFERGRQRHSVT